MLYVVMLPVATWAGPYAAEATQHVMDAGQKSSAPHRVHPFDALVPTYVLSDGTGHPPGQPFPVVPEAVGGGGG